eukprot:3734522-Amphidinium_carterae.3
MHPQWLPRLQATRLQQCVVLCALHSIASLTIDDALQTSVTHQSSKTVVRVIQARRMSISVEAIGVHEAVLGESRQQVSHSLQL